MKVCILLDGRANLLAMCALQRRRNTRKRSEAALAGCTFIASFAVRFQRAAIKFRGHSLRGVHALIIWHVSVPSAPATPFVCALFFQRTNLRERGFLDVAASARSVMVDGCVNARRLDGVKKDLACESVRVSDCNVNRSCKHGHNYRVTVSIGKLTKVCYRCA